MVVAQAFIPSTPKAEAGEYLEFKASPGLQSRLQDPVLKNKQKILVRSRVVVAHIFNRSIWEGETSGSF